MDLWRRRRIDGLQRYFPVQQREGAYSNQCIVEDRQYGGDAIDPFETQRQVNQHSGQRIKGGEERLLAQLLPDLRADDLDVADTKVGHEEAVLQRGDGRGSGCALEFIDGAEHAAFYLVAIIDK